MEVGKYNFHFNEDFRNTFIELGKTVGQCNRQRMNIAANIDFSAVQQLMNSVSTIVESVRPLSVDILNIHTQTLRDIGKTFNRTNLIRVDQLAKTISMNTHPVLQNLQPLYNVLNKHQNWLSDIEFTEDDVAYAIDVIENEEWESFVEQDLPNKEKEELSVKEKLLIARIQLVVDILMLIFTVIFPPFEINVTSIQKNYNIHIENATFHSDKEGIKWLNDELTKEHLEQNYRIVTKDNLTVRTEMKKNSHIAGTLQTGNIVQIIRKERNWSYIMYSDPDNGDLFSGWTNTSYLKSVGNKR